jgi:hypothetical protein
MNHRHFPRWRLPPGRFSAGPKVIDFATEKNCRGLTENLDKESTIF